MKFCRSYYYRKSTEKKGGGEKTFPSAKDHKTNIEYLPEQTVLPDPLNCKN